MRPGELVDDDDLAIADDVLHVLLEQGVGTQGRVDVVHQGDVAGVVEALALRQQAHLGELVLHLLMAVLTQIGLAGLFVHGEVAGTKVRLALLVGDGGLSDQGRDDDVDALVEVGAALGRPRDDQRGACLVDQDGVHLVHDRIEGVALGALLRRERHVVAQVVETELVVGPVGDVRGIGFSAGDRAHMPVALALRGQVIRVEHVGGAIRAHATGGVNDTHAQAEEAVDAPHPGRVAAGQVVVHRYHVHTLARQGVEIDGQGCDQGLALAGAHLRDLAGVEHHAADELHIEVAHAQGPLGRLADDREGLREQVVELGTVGQAGAELSRLGLEFCVAQGLEGGLEGADLGDRLEQPLDQTLVAAAEDLLENVGDHS